MMMGLYIVLVTVFHVRTEDMAQLDDGYVEHAFENRTSVVYTSSQTPADDRHYRMRVLKLLLH